MKYVSVWDALAANDVRKYNHEQEEIKVKEKTQKDLLRDILKV